MATDAAPLTLVPSPAVTRALLAWPTEERQALLRALQDSIADDETDPETERARNRALIHARVAELTSGKAKIVDAEEMFAAMRRAIEEVRGE